MLIVKAAWVPATKCWHGSETARPAQTGINAYTITEASSLSLPLAFDVAADSTDDWLWKQDYGSDFFLKKEGVVGGNMDQITDKQYQCP